MKAFLSVLICCSCFLASSANSPYRNYLLSKIYYQPQPEVTQAYHDISATPVVSITYIPRFERPKGAIFCRMEDMVTKATKVWLKLGVE